MVWSADSSSSQLSHLQFRFRFLSESLDSYFQPLFTWDNLLAFLLFILLVFMLLPLPEVR